MKHKPGFNKLSKGASHRKAMIKNMTTSLLRHERITTTKAKAKEIQKTAEKMITRAKVDSVHNRRLIARSIQDKEILAKLFIEIGPRFKERKGGYTSIIKVGHRQGDAAEMVILEFVKDEEEKSSKKKTKKKAASAPKAEKKVEEPKAEEVKEEAVAEEKAEEKVEEKADTDAAEEKAEEPVESSEETEEKAEDSEEEK